MPPIVASAMIRMRIKVPMKSMALIGENRGL